MDQKFECDLRTFRPFENVEQKVSSITIAALKHIGANKAVLIGGHSLDYYCNPIFDKSNTFQESPIRMEILGTKDSFLYAGRKVISINSNSTNLIKLDIYLNNRLRKDSVLLFRRDGSKYTIINFKE